MSYLPGHKPSQVRHHAWRTAQNSAAYLLPSLTALASTTPHLQMLDVGSGPGSMSASFAKLNPHGHVTATDISSQVLSQAQEHAASVGAENMTFRVADALSLPFDDASFHVVHAQQLLCHLPDPVPAIREMLRVVKPGGIVALREADLRLWCVWPDWEPLTRFHELMIRSHESAGGSITGGRQLLSWALNAGADRDKSTFGWGVDNYSQPDERAMWGE